MTRPALAASLAQVHGERAFLSPTMPLVLQQRGPNKKPEEVLVQHRGKGHNKMPVKPVRACVDIQSLLHEIAYNFLTGFVLKCILRIPGV